MFLTNVFSNQPVAPDMVVCALQYFTGWYLVFRMTFAFKKKMAVVSSKVKPVQLLWLWLEKT